MDGVPHHIQRIDTTAVDTLYVVLRAWSPDAAYSEIGVALLSDTMALFQPCDKPTSPRTWYSRILDDD
jgi:hypothetical protein